MRALALLSTAILAGCYYPAPPPPYGAPAPAPTGATGVFWQGAGWTVERIPVPGAPPPARYCSASRDDAGPDFAFTETPAGLVGWNVVDTTHQARPGIAYPVQLNLGPSGTFDYMAYMIVPGRLTGAAVPRPTADRLRDAAAQSPGVDIASQALGNLGGFSLAGARDMLPQLDICARRPS